MKESEAKTKWCPYMAQVNTSAMISFTIAAAHDGGGDLPSIGEARCIGSDCMMWQWLGDNSGGWCGLTNTGYGGIE